ncbi:hypothetical protein [Gordonia sp. (in: high G+C Gram-positive bacteria)]|uniref:hypothetical protein n=1 Tax=Gordonia sp. (in: high G+C Gram-positive bacteria) TaxID=84139 RepID=UPI003C719E29
MSTKPQMFRKKPVVIEAMQLSAVLAQQHAVYQWVEQHTNGSFDVNQMWIDPESFAWPESGVSIDARDGRMVIATLEGGHWADVGDWIIRGVMGEFYPCKPDVFLSTYEPVAAALTRRPRSRALSSARLSYRGYQVTIAEELSSVPGMVWVHVEGLRPDAEVLVPSGEIIAYWDEEAAK